MLEGAKLYGKYADDSDLFTGPTNVKRLFYNRIYAHRLFNNLQDSPLTEQALHCHGAEEFSNAATAQEQGLQNRPEHTYPSGSKYTG